MNTNQAVRGVVAGLITVAYAARLVTVGNGTVTAFGYAINPFALTLLVLLVLAVPETLDQLPVGPRREK